MSFIGFNGHGYNSFVAESGDLVHWKQFPLGDGLRQARSEFDHGGWLIGAFLYELVSTSAVPASS